MQRIALVAAGLLLVTGCAGMSGAQKGAAVGAATGAAAGAVIGNQVPGNRSAHAGTGAIIGALGGAAAGALIGDAMDRSAAPPPAPPPLPAPATSLPPPAPPASQAAVSLPGQYASDPTRGQLVNGTPFRLQVYLDADPARGSGGPTLSLQPSEVVPVNLDVGPHRIVAIASRETQFGPRTVGRLDRSLQVDVRGSGWEVRFHEGDFR